MIQRRRFDTRDLPSEIDLTPMIDMVFILLIFFIVSTSFIKEAGVMVERPSAATAQAQRVQMVIAVDASNVLWMEGASMDIRSLPARLTRLKSEKNDLSVIVAADVNCNAGILIRVIDLCRQAGITDVSVATKEPR